jgi:hypothetical protein
VLVAACGCSETCLVSPTSAALGAGWTNPKYVKLTAVTAKPSKDAWLKSPGRMIYP